MINFEYRWMKIVLFCFIIIFAYSDIFVESGNSSHSGRVVYEYVTLSLRVFILTLLRFDSGTLSLYWFYSEIIDFLVNLPTINYNLSYVRHNCELILVFCTADSGIHYTSYLTLVWGFWRITPSCWNTRRPSSLVQRDTLARKYTTRVHMKDTKWCGWW